ncbi:hypothetical protein [Candidatus Contubernalis alkaliaceticus]|uniref:hypothetical protein n=1 Tax=Candidatus Contubernalis alkaliaceticus TaxID=338645 RepID=UPI001F4C0904|nr:hypothetical protein [Candidatus Contubernalis alkalaceticus]UNC91988.1 hypothetical protein HUE98_07685 [Candidatus Contubernalis alkalaceticus]
MAIIMILAVLVLGAVLFRVEVPRMKKEKLHRELWAFSILLGVGIALVAMKSLDVEVPNPSDFIAWLYSPAADIMKSLLE